jgi:trigger factor
VKSALESLSPTRVRLTVEVPFEELGPALESAYRRIAAQVQLPGFRKGRVPPRLIDQRFGRAVVLEDAVNEALPRFYTRSVEENSVEPLGQPEIDVAEFVDGGDLKFTAEVDVRPPIQLPEFDSLEVVVPDAGVTDAEVEEQLRELRGRFSTLITVDRPAQEGDFLQLDLAVKVDGAEVEDGRAAGMSFEVGSKSLVRGLDEAVIGLAAGDTTTFTTTELGGAHAGKEGEVEVAVKTVRVRELPELDDEFAQTASEFDTLEELTAGLRDRLGRVKLMEREAQARDRVLEVLLEKINLPLPERVLEQEIKARKEVFEQQLAAAGMAKERFLEQQGETEEEFDSDLAQRTRRALAAQLVLDEVARKEQLSVSEAELSDQIVRRAARAGMSPEALAKQLVEAGEVPHLVNEVVRGKALALVFEAANIIDESGRPVHLDETKPPARPAVSDDESADDESADDESADDESADDESAGDAESETPSLATSGEASGEAGRD